MNHHLIKRYFRKKQGTLIVPFFFLLTTGAIAQPVINSFSPKSGPVGTTVVISGNNFSTTPASNNVYFGAVRGKVTAATATSLTVTVPLHATYQPITVNTNGLTANSKIPFTVTFTSTSAVFTSGSFANKTDIGTLDNDGTYFGKRIIADIDGDGKPDVVQANPGSQKLVVYRNTSAAGVLSFAAKTEFSFAQDDAGANSIAVGDIDDDGKPDIVMTALTGQPSASSGKIFILRNTSISGVVNFSSKIVIGSIGFDPSNITVRDADGDGKSDILVTYFKSESAVVFKNTGIGNTISFTSGTSLSGGRSIVISDIDLDGKPDIAGQASTIGAPVTFVPVSRNTSVGGTASFANSQIFYGTGLGSYPLAVADLDGDDKPEMAIITRDSVLASTHNFRSNDTLLTVLQNTSVSGTISFNPKKDFFYRRGLGYTDLKIADLDGDGKQDILSVVGDSVSIQKNISTLGNISLDSLSRYGASANIQNVDVTDMDGDGKADIIVTYATGFSILRNIPAVVTAVDEGTNNDKSIAVFPNPAQNFIKVIYPDGYRNAEIRILSLDGKKQLTTRPGYTANNTAMLNIQALAKGTYVLSLIKKGKPLVTKYFVKM